MQIINKLQSAAFKLGTALKAIVFLFSLSVFLYSCEKDDIPKEINGNIEDNINHLNQFDEAYSLHHLKENPGPSGGATDSDGGGFVNLEDHLESPPDFFPGDSDTIIFNPPSPDFDPDKFDDGPSEPSPTPPSNTPKRDPKVPLKDLKHAEDINGTLN